MKYENTRVVAFGKSACREPPDTWAKKVPMLSSIKNKF